jgi:hypothetical protein
LTPSTKGSTEEATLVLQNFGPRYFLLVMH